MVRPIDLLLQFLEAERADGVTHVHLDEGARDGLRDLFLRSRTGAPAAARPPVAVAVVEPLAATTVATAAAPPARTVEVAGGSKSQQLDSLRRQAEQWGPARALGTLRDKLVFSVGNPDARLMLVGEAPGYEEERSGQPFVSAAGQKLNDILKAMEIAREDVFLAYVVKFRPAVARQSTNSRPPTAVEMAACLPLVRAEVGIVRPQCMVALGATAAEGLAGLAGSVAGLRGKWHDFEGVPLRVTHHPGQLLRTTGGIGIKRELWEDMLAVMEQLGLPISGKQRGFFLPKP